MTTNEILTIIISSIGGSAVLFAVLAFLAKSLIKHFLEKDIESFKLNLQRVSFEHEIQFSKLHQDRARIIAGLYDRLYEFHWAVCAFLKDFHNTNRNSKKLLDDLNDKSYKFTDFFDKHRIYFTENICSKIDKLIYSLRSAYVPLERSSLDAKPNNQQMEQEWNKCAEVVQKTYPDIRKSLEKDFRSILGVIENLGS